LWLRATSFRDGDEVLRRGVAAQTMTS
jgi:hypothetical protein